MEFLQEGTTQIRFRVLSMRALRAARAFTLPKAQNSPKASY